MTSKKKGAVKELPSKKVATKDAANVKGGRIRLRP
jgi:hypothetical protein